MQHLNQLLFKQPKCLKVPETWVDARELLHFSGHWLFFSPLEQPDGALLAVFQTPTKHLLKNSTATSLLTNNDQDPSSSLKIL